MTLVKKAPLLDKPSLNMTGAWLEEGLSRNKKLSKPELG